MFKFKRNKVVLANEEFQRLLDEAREAHNDAMLAELWALISADLPAKKLRSGLLAFAQKWTPAGS